MFSPTWASSLSGSILSWPEKIAQDWPQCRVPVGRAYVPQLRNSGGGNSQTHPQPGMDRVLSTTAGFRSFLRSSDVLLIPHKESRLTLSMDPLKMYEYLTTGLPIVSTPVPPTGDYPSLDLCWKGKGLFRADRECPGGGASARCRRALAGPDRRVEETPLGEPGRQDRG